MGGDNHFIRILETSTFNFLLYQCKRLLKEQKYNYPHGNSMFYFTVFIKFVLWEVLGK